MSERPSLRARFAAPLDRYLERRFAALRDELVPIAAELRRISEELTRAASTLAQVRSEHAATAREDCEIHAAIRSELASVAGRLDALDRLPDVAHNAVALLRAQRDTIDWLRRQLNDMRESPEYEAVWTRETPLVTVRIATFNNAALLERALGTVLAQTYERFEVVVVGDHCTDDTEDRIRGLQDDRIRFVNLPYRSVYPDDAFRRWQVAGSPCMNLGARLARGDWIAPLDEDDEFSPNHLETLLGFAQPGRWEMAYGKLRRVTAPEGSIDEVWSYPPEFGGFSFQGAIYLKMLGFFEYDTKSWLVDEPGDWNLCRRMLESGVRIGATTEVVGTLHRIVKPREGPPIAPPGP